VTTSPPEFVLVTGGGGGAAVVVGVVRVDEVVGGVGSVVDGVVGVVVVVDRVELDSVVRVDELVDVVGAVEVVVLVRVCVTTASIIQVSMSHSQRRRVSNRARGRWLTNAKKGKRTGRTRGRHGCSICEQARVKNRGPRNRNSSQVLQLGETDGPAAN